MKSRSTTTGLILFSISCGLLSAGCQSKTSGTSTGNPFVTFGITGSARAATLAQYESPWNRLLTLISPQAFAFPPTSVVDSSGLSVTITSFWTTVGEIEFKASEFRETDEVDGEGIDFTGPYTVDLLDASPSSIVNGSISLNAVRRIKTKLIRTATLPNTAPGGLSGRSIYISGNVNGSAFTYSTQDETTIEVGGPNLVTIGDDTPLLLQIRTAEIFKRVDLSSISVPVDISESNRVNATTPCPQIDPSASDLYTCFRKGFEAEADFGADHNGDFELDVTNDDSVK